MSNERLNLLKLIGKDELDKVFKVLMDSEKVTENNVLLEEVVQLSARYKYLKTQENQNTISYSDFQLEISKIRKVLIGIVQSIDNKEATTNPIPSKILTSSNSNSLPKWAIILGIVLIGAIGVFGLKSFFLGSDRIEAKKQNTELAKSGNTDLQQKELEPSLTEKKRETLKEKPDENNTTKAKITNHNTVDFKPPVVKKTNRQPTSEKASPPAEKQTSVISQPSSNDELPTSTDAPLVLQVKTNKGKSNLTFKEGETMRLYFKVNRPCNLRIFYRLANGAMVLFDDDRKITKSEIGKYIEIGDGYVAAQPFGKESLYVFAQNTTFEKLKTRTENGYVIIEEGLPEALAKSKGFHGLKLSAEAKLEITTSE